MGIFLNKKPLFTFLTLCGLFFSIHSAEAGTLVRPPNNLGLIGYWNFNEGTSTLAGDYSGTGSSSTLTNMSFPPTATSGWTANGKLGNGLLFDGNDYVKVKDGTVVATLASTTLSIWFKTTLNTVGGGVSMYAERASSGNDIFKLDYGDGSSAGEPFFTWRNDAGTITQTRPTTVGGYNDGRWHHFLVTVGGTAVTIYVDGVQANTGTIAVKNFTDAGLESRIGGDKGGSPFVGSLDELRIYDRALTASQVSALYNSGASRFGGSSELTHGSLDEGLRGHWTFDGKDMVPNVRDVSGNGNHGYITFTGAGFTPATSTLPGKLGQALNIRTLGNGGVFDRVTLGSASSLDDLVDQGGGGQTYAFWYYARSGGGFGHGDIIGKPVNNQSGIQIDNQQVIFRSGFASTTLSVNSPALAFPYGHWRYVAVTWTGGDATSSVKIYLDGVDSTAPTGGTAGTGVRSSDASWNLEIGGGSQGPDGIMDDLRVYNRVLSISEIQQLYNLAQGKTNASSTALSQGTTLKDGLMGLWTFDGQDTVSTITDRSGQGNHGYFIGAATSSAKTIGKLGQALSFNGSNTYVAAPTISISTNVSASAWVYSSNFSQNGFIVGKNPVNTQWELFFESTNLKWRGGAGENNVLCVAPANNQWHHVVGTQAGTVSTLYIDGAQCSTGTQTAIGNGSGVVEIGRFTSGYYFNGKIDDARVYNRALSASEVKQLYLIGQ